MANLLFNVSYWDNLRGGGYNRNREVSADPDSQKTCLVYNNKLIRNMYFYNYISTYNVIRPFAYLCWYNVGKLKTSNFRPQYNGRHNVAPFSYLKS